MKYISKNFPNRLIIISAGAFGQEVYNWAKQDGWENVVFIDSRHGEDWDIVGTPESYIPKESDYFLCAIGEPRIKKKYAKRLMDRNAQFAALIHPTVNLGRNITISPGVIVGPYVVVSNEVTLHDHVAVHVHSSVGHNTTVGAYTQMYPHAIIGGWVEIGEEVTIGSGANILPRSVLEDQCVIGANSLAFYRTRTRQTILGVPGKPLGLQSKVET